MERLKTMFKLNKPNFIGGAIGFGCIILGDLLISLLGIAIFLYNVYIIKENYNFEFPNNWILKDKTFLILFIAYKQFLIYNYINNMEVFKMKNKREKMKRTLVGILIILMLSSVVCPTLLYFLN